MDPILLPLLTFVICTAAVIIGWFTDDIFRE